MSCTDVPLECWFFYFFYFPTHRELRMLFTPWSGRSVIIAWRNSTAGKTENRVVLESPVKSCDEKHHVSRDSFLIGQQLKTLHPLTCDWKAMWCGPVFHHLLIFWPEIGLYSGVFLHWAPCWLKGIISLLLTVWTVLACCDGEEGLNKRHFGSAFIS